MIDERFGVIYVSPDEVGHDVCFGVRCGAHQQADFRRLRRSGVPRRRLRDNLVLGHIGEMRDGDCSDLESALLQVEIGGTTALSHHIGNGRSLRAEA